MSWLADYFRRAFIRSNGAGLQDREALNFIGFTVADNPTTKAIDITAPGGSAPPTGTGFVTVASGVQDGASLAFPLSASKGGTGVASLGAGVATWMGTPSSASLLAAMTDKTGTGLVVFSVAPRLETPSIWNTGLTFRYIFGGSAIAANRTISLPLLGADDTFVFASHAQTLAGKSMSGASNTFSAIPFSAMATGVQSLPAVTSFATTVNAKAVDATREPVNVQTTSLTTTTLDSFTIASNSMVTVTWTVRAIKSDSSQAGAWLVSATFRNAAGTVTQLGSTSVTTIGTPDDAAWAPVCDNSTTTIRLRVPGKASITVQWGASGVVSSVVP